MSCAVLMTVALLGTARAEDRVETTTTWYQESRRGGLGGLTVINPRVDASIDAGEHSTVAAGYAADVVTGATAAVYATDAISTATPFDDVRHEGHLGLSFAGSRASFGVTVAAAAERDYLSMSLSGNAEVALPGKNTYLALAYTHSEDEVCDKDNAQAEPLERRALTGLDPCRTSLLSGQDSPGTTVWRDLAIETVQATLSQNLTPTLNAQLSLYGQVLQGFQSNPYRRVRIGAAEPQENIPDTRGRIALSALLNRYIVAAHSAIHLSARGYSDTWGVNSGSLELGYSQYAGSDLLLHLRARVYQQQEATFFKDAFFYETESAAGAYFTGDRELGRLRHAIVGAKLTVLTFAEETLVWGLFEAIRIHLAGDVFFLDELPADDEARNLAGINDQFLSSNQRLDAFTLQLSLQLGF